jgi:hypothetical protein
VVTDTGIVGVLLFINTQPVNRKGLSLKYNRLVVFSGTSVSSTNKTDCHDITKILLKVALITINQTYNAGTFEINQNLIKYNRFDIEYITKTIQ